MSRFSIRELLLLTVIVALALGWWLHSRRLNKELETIRINSAFRAEMIELESAISEAVRKRSASKTKILHEPYVVENSPK